MTTTQDITRDFYVLKGEMGAEIRVMRERMEKLEKAVEKVETTVETGFAKLHADIAALSNERSEQRGVRKSIAVAWGFVSALVIALLGALFQIYWGH